MDALMSDGHVTLNAEGKQYTASFQLGWGVITVTSGSVSRVMRLSQAAVAPQSVARTILREIVRENPQAAEVTRPDHDHWPDASKH